MEQSTPGITFKFDRLKPPHLPPDEEDHCGAVWCHTGNNLLSADLTAAATTWSQTGPHHGLQGLTEHEAMCESRR